ncbi:hypothetical protein F5Y14DRAFT_459178 [Nemania sp. NC0429]|nr:hypothetical protein F5Y14DRAFT_459178 [Nemania sp. NC0429]
MDEAASVQPLTWANLQRLEGKSPHKPKSPAASFTWSDFLPKDKLKRAKVLLSRILRRLPSLGPEGLQTRDQQDVYLDENLSLHYRGTGVSKPDLEDPHFWETRWRNLYDKYGLPYDLMEAKKLVYQEMVTMNSDWNNIRSEGHRLLDDYELYIAGEDDVRYRGHYPMPNLEDPAYWRTQYFYLRRPDTEVKERYAVADRAHIYRSGWNNMKKNIEAWIDDTGKETGTNLPGARGPAISRIPSERASVGGVEDSLGQPVRTTPYSRWNLATQGVYDRMTALWNLGSEGREIVKNDELRVVGIHDVRHRRSRSPKPNLQDPSYWEAKWEYFTEKLVSLLAKRDDLNLDEDRMGLPIPGQESDVLSAEPSPVKSLRPNSVSRRASAIEKVKEKMYETLTTYFYRYEGQDVLENDEVYVAGENDIRYRENIRPQPNLDDPRYWEAKNAYFDTIYKSFTSSQGYIAYPALNDSHPALPAQTQAQASATGGVAHVGTLAQDPIGGSDPTPVIETTSATATRSQTSSKRKRADQLDDTSQTEEQSARPAKRNKSSTIQAGQTGSGTTVQQPHILNPASDSGLSQLSGLPDVVEERNQTTTKTRPPVGKNQDKIRGGTRASRRVAGLLPEFSSMIKEGEEPRPYEETIPRPSDTRASRRVAGLLPEFASMIKEGEKPRPYEEMMLRPSDTRDAEKSDSPETRKPGKPTTTKGVQHGRVSRPVREDTRKQEGPAAIKGVKHGRVSKSVPKNTQKPKKQTATKGVKPGGVSKSVRENVTNEPTLPPPSNTRETEEPNSRETQQPEKPTTSKTSKGVLHGRVSKTTKKTVAPKIQRRRG